LSFFADARAARLDGATADDLARRLALPRVALFDEVGSTLDVAHAMAPDAPSGTLIVADEQTAGRGRHGRRWASAPGVGVWLTLIERPTDARALDVLSLRCGLYAAEALDALAGARAG
jgi:BirA family transcriptional regulator, biotin operon repressor / biotin---[acetyl-CoA-carboxylase] ligase